MMIQSTSPTLVSYLAIFLASVVSSAHGFSFRSLTAATRAFSPRFDLHVTRAAVSSRTCRARDLVKSLVEEDECFSTESGAYAFGEVCAPDIVYEDRFEPQPILGRAVRRENCFLSVDVLGAVLCA
jgi:hypothetical protein